VEKGSSSSIAGPLFISIGDEEKLNVFLDKNPHVPRENAFVDGYDFAAYQAAGFGKFDTDKAKGWWNYFTSVGKISPIPKDMKFGEIPEGVLRLGGTFVIQGDTIVYQWSDRLPGDHPNVAEVWNIAKEAAAAATATAPKEAK
jgi:hypothetical protein